MSVLKQVLAAFDDTSQPLSIQQIARQIGVETALVEDMISFWVRKGKIRDASAACTCPPTGCGHCAVGGSCCPFMMPMPKRYERVT